MHHGRTQAARDAQNLKHQARRAEVPLREFTKTRPLGRAWLERKRVIKDAPLGLGKTNRGGKKGQAHRQRRKLGELCAKVVRALKGKR